MKHLYLFVALILFNLRATAAVSVAPDTIPGQSRLVKQLTAEACQQLDTEQQRASLTNLSAAQAQATFERVLSAAIEKGVPAINRLAQRSNTAGAYEKLRATLPTAVALRMIQTCSPASTLYNRFSNSVVAPAGPEKAFIESWETSYAHG